MSTPSRAGAAGLALAAVIAAMVAGTTAPSVSAAASPTGPVVVSPLPGTPDANPDTQISFLGQPASDLRDIVVTGSRSGVHSGRLESYSTHTGGSFLPSQPFIPGEQVTVRATVDVAGSASQIGTTFAVSSPYSLPAPAPTKATRARAGTVMKFVSRQDLEPPIFSVTTPAADPALGDVFVSPDSGPGQAGAMIVGPTGQLIWFDPMPPGQEAFNLDVQTYHDQPVLTWWQGNVVDAHGQGADVIESSRYTPIATVHAGNGLYADLHDFRITPQGTAWLTAYAPQHVDLSQYGGLRNGLISDGVVQEVDIKTGLVMYEWHALGHVAITDSYMHLPKWPSTVLDYFHINSVQPLPDGRILISSRNTWAAYMVDVASGSIVWRLGGKKSSFAPGPGATFAWQHDVQLLPDGTISLFDNEAGPPEASQSRVLDIALHRHKHTATLVHELTYPGKGILSGSQGDVQQLAGGDQFVGWGQAGEVSEFSPTGALTFDMRFAQPTNSYRAFRIAWNAQPASPPALTADRSGSATTMYASWNGATDVAAWRVLAGNAPDALSPAGAASYPSQGFETTINAVTARYVSVEALSSAGAVLGTSAVDDTGTPPLPRTAAPPSSAAQDGGTVAKVP